MAVVSSLLVFFFFLGAAQADLIPSFSFAHFGKDSGFESEIELLGDAEVVDRGSSVRLTADLSSSAGRLMYKKPIKLVGQADKVSFSTNFSFSISPDGGDGVAFSLLPAGFPVGAVVGALVVEFDILAGDANENRTGLVSVFNSFASARSTNLSSLNLGMNGGEKLHCWIDYEAGSELLEVRLSRSGNRRPFDPLLSHSLNDWSGLWKEGDVSVGISSSNRKSSQTCKVHSWSFQLTPIPHQLHSLSFAAAFPEKANPDPAAGGRRRNTRLLSSLAAVIWGTGCGSLLAFLGLLSWSVLGGGERPAVVVPVHLPLLLPEEFAGGPKGFDYEKFEVVVADEETIKECGRRGGACRCH